MSVDDAVKIVRELGFPVAVAAFVLWRLEARLRELTTAIHELTELCGVCRVAQQWNGRYRRKTDPPNTDDR